HIATERATGFLTADGLRRFLAGQTPEPAQLIPASELFGMDYRVGIGVNGATQTVREGHTFGRGFLALRGGVFLYSEAEIPETAGGANCAAAEALGRLGVIPLGGEGRQALVTTIPPLAWPAATAANARGRGQILLLLTTPCPLREGWRPRALANHLAAAAVPEPIPFSGWDLARGGPRPTRFAVPAGSVYFLSASPEDLPKSLAEDEEEARQGWGCFLKGEWTDE
ncbi:MAG: hypothetical protein N3A66_08460, partial [Planctomycetota bacterium]|nr:hypothetical protein [Planctomycetota bacterium]